MQGLKEKNRKENAILNKGFCMKGALMQYGNRMLKRIQSALDSAMFRLGVCVIWTYLMY
jgi:hypothetical protein